jgi:hypothetical protein
MQEFRDGEKVKYLKYKNKIAEIVLYIPATEFTNMQYAIKYQRGSLVVHDIVDAILLDKCDDIYSYQQLSLFNK